MTRLEKLLYIVLGVCDAQHGRRQDLANKIGARLSQVSEWLNPDNPRKPNGDTALRILDWLQDTDLSAWRLYGIRKK